MSPNSSFIIVRKTVVRIGPDYVHDPVASRCACSPPPHDPTGLSSPIGHIAVIAVLIAATVIGVRALWQGRGIGPLSVAEGTMDGWLTRH